MLSGALVALLCLAVFVVFRLGLWRNLSSPKASVMFLFIFFGTLQTGTFYWALDLLRSAIFM